MDIKNIENKKFNSMDDFIIPDCHKFPKWVDTTYETFKENVTNDAKQFKGIELRKKIIKNIEGLILSNKNSKFGIKYRIPIKIISESIYSCILILHFP